MAFQDTEQDENRDTWSRARQQAVGQPRTNHSPGCRGSSSLAKTSVFDRVPMDLRAAQTKNWGQSAPPLSNPFEISNRCGWRSVQSPFFHSPSGSAQKPLRPPGGAPWTLRPTQRDQNSSVFDGVDAKSRTRKGSALLAVLWFSAALSAIAFTLSMTVRTELDRAALQVDSTRAYFLAQGAIEIALKRMLEGRPTDELSGLPGFVAGQRFMRIPFPLGVVDVEIIGDSGKVDVKRSSPDVLAQLLTASGVPPGAAVGIAGRIVELRRGPVAQGINSMQGSSFLRPGTSFEELEELLMVPGVTPDLLYGTFGRDPDGRLMRLGGLYHHLALQGSGGIDVNYASVEVLRAAGLSPGEIDRILQIRAVRPLTGDDLSGLAGRTEGFSLGSRGLSTHYNLWATARLSNGSAVRTTGARVLQARDAGPFGIQIIRWFDTAF